VGKQVNSIIFLYFLVVNCIEDLWLDHDGKGVSRQGLRVFLGGTACQELKG
jgi:hypothetical protein